MGYQSSGGLKTSTTVKEANIKTENTNSQSTVDIIIQNQSTSVLKLKWGKDATADDYDVVLKACTAAEDGTSIAAVLENFPDSQVISCWSSGTPSYTFSFL